MARAVKPRNVLQHIAEVADIGSAQEFNDYEARLACIALMLKRYEESVLKQRFKNLENHEPPHPQLREG